MNFFDMNFSTLFLEKHGEELFSSISKQILKEKLVESDENYIEVVFKVAFLDFFGLKDGEITKMIEDFMKCKVDVGEIKCMHSGAIGRIQECLQISVDGTYFEK